MRRRWALALVAPLIAVALTSCGAPSADLFVVTRSGSIPGAGLKLLVSDGGTVRCNDGPEREVSSDALIRAREITFELNGDDKHDGPARHDLQLAPGPGTILRYSVRSEQGSVAFSDTSAHQPQAFYKAAQFTRDIAKRTCGLAR